MESTAIILLIISLFLLLHVYIFYPILIKIIVLLFEKKYKTKTDSFPTISIIISAYNEQAVIENTIQNLLKSDYDLTKIEIVIGSDNSTDDTNNILEKLKIQFSNIKFFPFSERRGKANVLNDLVKSAQGEILVFSDANTIYKTNAIKELVKYYVDDRVGGVCGKLVLLDLEKAKMDGSQEKEYWEYESWIKNLEGKLGILIGANGGIYSIRKSLYQNIPSEFPVMDDFYIGLKVLEQFKDMTYAKEAVATEYVAPSVRWEFKRKVRTISINLDSIRFVKRLLSPKFGLIAFAFWSHKIIRWITPILLLLIFISNLFLLDTPFYNFFFYLQLLFYFSAFVGFLLSLAKRSISIFSMSYYFVVTNAALTVGIYKFIMKKQSAVWQSTERV